MKFSVDRQEQYTVITLNERKLDTTIAPDAKSELVKLQSDGVPNLIIDLRNTKYSDSSGLSALLTANRLFGEKGSFVLCNVNEHVMKLIKISRLDQVIHMASSLEEAIDRVLASTIDKDTPQGRNKGE